MTVQPSLLAYLKAKGHNIMAQGMKKDLTVISVKVRSVLKTLFVLQLLIFLSSAVLTSKFQRSKAH